MLDEFYHGTEGERTDTLNRLYQQEEAGRKYARKYRPRHMLTDSQYEQQYDPQGSLERRKVHALEEIARSLDLLTLEPVEAGPRVNSSLDQRKQTSTGTVEL